MEKTVRNPPTKGEIIFGRTLIVIALLILFTLSLANLLISLESWHSVMSAGLTRTVQIIMDVIWFFLILKIFDQMKPKEVVSETTTPLIIAAFVIAVLGTFLEKLFWGGVVMNDICIAWLDVNIIIQLPSAWKSALVD
ncbi:MAG TPA: hypothetical protein VG694_02635 [Candidatus Paceibacterota bacterium]|nr:hypothetical protein [Candidatus Paceibacterota bacterium]